MAVVELGDRLDDAKRCGHSPFGVVFVRDGCAEDRHHRIADELLDRAPEAFDLLFHARVIRTQPRTHVLGIRLLRCGGEADEVDEQDRHDLSFFCGGARLFVERRSARPAEASPLRILFAAVRADGHARSLGRHSLSTETRVFDGYRRGMDEARAVLARLDRIEQLEREGAPPGAVLEELRGLVQAAEAWVRLEGGERAEKAVERCAAALAQPVT